MMSALKHRVWEILSSDGDLDSEFGRESKDAQKEAFNYSFALWMRFNDLKATMHHNYHVMSEAADTSEDPDVVLKELIKIHPYREALEAIHKGDDYEPFLWKILEPKD